VILALVKTSQSKVENRKQTKLSNTANQRVLTTFDECLCLNFVTISFYGHRKVVKRVSKLKTAFSAWNKIVKHMKLTQGLEQIRDIQTRFKNKKSEVWRIIVILNAC